MCSQSLFIHDIADLEVSLLKIPMEERIKVPFSVFNDNELGYHTCTWGCLVISQYQI